MNILYLINHAGKGGTEKYIKVLIQAMKKNNNIFFMYNERGELCDYMENIGINPIQINMPTPFNLKTSKQIANFCKLNKIDIVHTQFQREAYLCAVAKLFYSNFKLVYTYHINNNNNLFIKSTNILLGKKYDAIISVSSLGKKLLIKNRLPKNKIEVIFNGINYDESHVKDQTNLYIKTEFGISQNTFIFTTLTRFTEEKGNIFLLHSIKKLISLTNKNFMVLFVGDGPLIDECKLYATKNDLHNFVNFTGYRNDTMEILKNSNVFLNSSSNEALSFAILEAMSVSLPLIVTNVGGNTDIVNETTNCGIITEYGNTNDYAQAMQKFIDNSDFACSCGLNSKLAIKNIFNIDKTIDETNRIYERLINNDR